jgi:FixJ family two-component response regulator
MPEMQGDELARKMLRVNPQLRVLICSGYPVSVESIAEDPSQIGFLQKPFLPAMLQEAVAGLLS